VGLRRVVDMRPERRHIRLLRRTVHSLNGEGVRLGLKMKKEAKAEEKRI
jgi:hypothetical protein